MDRLRLVVSATLEANQHRATDEQQRANDSDDEELVIRIKALARVPMVVWVNIVGIGVNREHFRPLTEA